MKYLQLMVYLAIVMPVMGNAIAGQFNATANSCLESDYDNPNDFIVAIDHKHLENGIQLNRRGIALKDEAVSDGCIEQRSDSFLAAKEFEKLLKEKQDLRRAMRWILCNSPKDLKLDAGYSSVAIKKLFPIATKFAKQLDLNFSEECDTDFRIREDDVRPVLIEAGWALQSFAQDIVNHCAPMSNPGHDKHFQSYRTNPEDVFSFYLPVIFNNCKSIGVSNNYDWHMFQDEVRLKRDNQKIGGGKEYVANAHNLAMAGLYERGRFADTCPGRGAIASYKIGAISFVCKGNSQFNRTVLLNQKGEFRQSNEKEPNFDADAANFIRNYYKNYGITRIGVVNRCETALKRDGLQNSIKALVTRGSIKNGNLQIMFSCIGDQHFSCGNSYTIDSNGKFRLSDDPVNSSSQSCREVGPF